MSSRWALPVLREVRSPRRDRGGKCRTPQKKRVLPVSPNDELLLFDAVLHVFLVSSGDMQTVWFPVPVTALFRRIVNVVSAFSISHHYLHQSLADPDQPCPKPYSHRWTAWKRAKSQDACRKTPVNSLDAYMDPPERTEVQDPPRHTADSYDSWAPDQIHLLINNPALYEPLRKPRYPIVLCHGECAVTEVGRGIDANAGQDCTASTFVDRPRSPFCSSIIGLMS